ncbi:hypothetical protein Nepgr_005287 [Nepenthes gracilis]|uniref:Uncharacterized protein n=1 Tax=Nepenthes gracilis TaxID=150966 RepID=A0AAD3XG92_NEPGR|nr:hypothetical protein Nepgr_005287 [Nepenthes gracilis]
MRDSATAFCGNAHGDPQDGWLLVPSVEYWGCLVDVNSIVLLLKSRAGFSKSSSSPGIEPTIRATSNQPEPDSNGYTNLHISRQIPFRSPTLGASTSSGFIQHSSQKTNTARSATSNLTTISSKSSVPGQQHCGPIRICYSRAEKAERMQQPHPSIRTNVSSEDSNSYHPYCARTYHSSSQRRHRSATLPQCSNQHGGQPYSSIKFQ